MKRRSFLAAMPAAAAAFGAPALAQGGKVLRFIPQSDVTVLDPVVSTANATRDHAYMIFDTLYGTDRQYRASPQMAAGHVVEDDGRRWTITLREGLVWHDGEKVLARDCVASIRRWGRRDTFGQTLMAVTDDLAAPDDRTIVFRLKEPFPLLPEALGKLPSLMPAMMPERMARTDAFTQITEMTGSGPFRYRADERMVGARVVYEKFAGYVPRQGGTADWTAGPKIVHVDRVEWSVLGDPGTAAAAMQSGQHDWLAFVSADVAPLLRRSAHLRVENLEPSGAFSTLRFNHLQPPFDNPAIRRALLGAINQSDFVTAVTNSNPALYSIPTGYFPPGTPFASDAGLDAIKASSDYDRVKRDLAAAGYRGEKVVFLGATDPEYVKPLADICANMLQRSGMNVDYRVSDFGTLISRRNSRAPVDQGGWSAFQTTWSGIDMMNPASQAMLRGNGTDAWIGWPTSPRLEDLRQQWLRAPDLMAQQAIARSMQQQAFTDVPYLPLGLFRLQSAYNTRLDGVLRGFPVFWNVRKEA